MTTTESATATAIPAATPPLARAEVAVWIAKLSAQDVVRARLEETLSDEEREHASRLRFEELRRRYVVAHGFLRTVLAGYLRCAPEAVRVVPGQHGKPELAAGTLRFNLSHSGDVAAC